MSTEKWEDWFEYDDWSEWVQDPKDHGGDHKGLDLRHLDGTYNNPKHIEWGSAGTQFLRLTPVSYEDGISETYEPRTNYRELSNHIIKQNGEIKNSHGVNDLFTFFGQFIDHDIDLALEGHEEGPYVIAPKYDLPPFQGKKLGIERSKPSDGTGYDEYNPRQHDNAITSYVDASNVYGSDESVMQSLRDTNKPWLLKMHDNGNLLPLSEGMHPQFLAGDIRAGENSALTSVHTIWAKEHNRIATELHEKNPDWSHDKIFHTAKITVEALMQHVVFHEWLPLLVGEHAMPEYYGYDAHVDPGISHEFATAAFRLGHSLLSSNIKRIDEHGDSTGDLQLAQMFFNAAILKDAGSVDTLVRGLAAYKAQEIDHKLVEDVRSLLFPGADGIQVRDLSVLNNLRNLDHGLGTLNEVREALGYKAYKSFHDLTGDRGLAKALKKHYDSVDDVELWIGGLLEQKVHGSQLGEVFHHIVVDQFTRLRDGDKFYYEERLKDYPYTLEQIKKTTFSEIIQRNTDIKYLQDDVFIAHYRMAGTYENDKMHGTKGHELMMGYDGHDKIKAKHGDDDIYAGDGHDKIWAGKGHDVIYGEGGNDWMNGGKGRDTFVFKEGSGHDKIKGFKTKWDVLDISDYGFTSMWDVYESAYNTRKGVVIELDYEGYDTVTLHGVKLKHLKEQNFVFEDNGYVVV